MKIEWSDEQISKIIDQSLIYQCACPAQVCKEIIGLRLLYQYQTSCINQTGTDKLVHERIAQDAASSHQTMEACLQKILELEGWDLITLKMPENLKKLTLKA
ncbi:MAG: hypothetical protein R8M14_04110 [Ghiorsea sp.]